VHSPAALYGHVPFLLAHSVDFTTGLLWLNSAETWVDLESGTVIIIMILIILLLIMKGKGKAAKKTHAVDQRKRPRGLLRVLWSKTKRRFLSVQPHDW
jgi:uncharacterized membrane protein